LVYISGDFYKQKAMVNKTIVHVVDGIAFVLFDSETLLKSAFYRVHCYYDGHLKGPLRGVNLPWETYLNWHSSVELTASEQEIHNVVSTSDIKYIVACIRGDTSTLIHEYAHAVFHLNQEYRRIAEKCYHSLDEKIKTYINKELAIRNYTQDKWIDEFQAYILEGPQELGKKFNLSHIHRTLKKAIGPVPIIN
jgi:hypothetical protein